MQSVRPAQPIKRTHTILAMMFLAVMLIEWGSHSLAFTHSGSPGGMIAISSSEPEHEDPLHTMVDCCENGKNGGTVVSPSHHLPSFNSFVELIRFAPVYARDIAATLLLREDVQRIFRPKDPLLHPPELS